MFVELHVFTCINGLQRLQPPVLEVHSLGIDHVREADMVWIAEEAPAPNLHPGDCKLQLFRRPKETKIGRKWLVGRV